MIYRPTILAFATGLSFLGLGGCDRLPESISGRSDPNATAIAPVGPSGSSSSSIDGFAAVEPPAMVTTHEHNNHLAIAPNPFEMVSTQLTPRDGSVYVAQTNASSDAGALTTAYTQESAPSGLQVPPAEANNRTTDRKIFLDSAHLKFVEDIEMAASADGRITKLEAEEGDILIANSPMIQLDNRLANSELQVTKKELEAATKKAEDDSEIKYSKAAHEVAREEYTIAQEIDKKGAGTATELSKKWLEYKRAYLAIAVAEVKNKQDVLAIGVAEAKQDAAGVQVAMREIVAPFDGIVAEKRKECHDWVRAGDVILRLVSMEQLRVVSQVRVEQLTAAPHELVGAPANIDITIYPGKVERVAARVGFVSPVMEVSGGYRIWLQIPNVKVKDHWLFREGMSATVEIATR